MTSLPPSSLPLSPDPRVEKVVREVRTHGRSAVLVLSEGEARRLCVEVSRHDNTLKVKVEWGEFRFAPEATWVVAESPDRGGDGDRGGTG